MKSKTLILVGSIIIFASIVPVYAQINTTGWNYLSEYNDREVLINSGALRKHALRLDVGKSQCFLGDHYYTGTLTEMQNVVKWNISFGGGNCQTTAYDNQTIKWKCLVAKSWCDNENTAVMRLDIVVTAYFTLKLKSVPVQKPIVKSPPSLPSTSLIPFSNGTIIQPTIQTTTQSVQHVSETLFNPFSVVIQIISDVFKNIISFFNLLFK